MSLSVALVNALSGLRISQVGVQWTSQNVGNLNTPGYTRKVVNQEAMLPSGARITSVDRFVDQGLARQMRVEQSKLGAFQVADGYLSRLGEFLGNPADGGKVASDLAGLSAALETLATSPGAIENLVAVRDAGSQLARELNATSGQIQALRAEADGEIGTSIRTINEALSEIDRLNTEIVRLQALRQPTGQHEDQRDLAVGRIAEQIPVRVFDKGDGSIGLYLPSGLALLDASPRYLNEYQAQATVTAAVPRSFQQITFVEDGSTDITTLLQGGRLGELIALRDTTLPRFQRQLDALAVQLRDQINLVHNRGTSDPPRGSLTAGQTFDSDNVSFTFDDGETRLVLFDADGKEQAVIDFKSLQGPATAENPVPLPTDFTMRDLLTTLNAYLPANTTHGGVVLSDIIDVPAVPPAGPPNPQVELSFSVTAAYSGYGVALVDEPAADGPAAAITVSTTAPPASVERHGFSDVFGFNDFFVDDGGEPSWTSATYPAGYKMPTDGTITVMTSRGSYQVAYSVGETLQDVATRIETTFPDELQAYVYRDGESYSLRVGSDASPQAEVFDVTASNAALSFSRQEVGPSSTLRLRDDLAENPYLIAKGRPVNDPYHGYDIGSADGSIAQQMADTFQANFDYPAVGGLPSYATTFADFNAQLVGQISGAAHRAEEDLAFEEGFTDMLERRISEGSGVNIDEELTQLMKLQNAYAAAARVISTIETMFDTLEAL